jgi:hypothetical protein
MSADLHRTDVPLSENPPPRGGDADDSLWAFLPILVSLAAICLLMFLLIPGFEAADPVSATSDRPGEDISMTVPEGSKSVQAR